MTPKDEVERLREFAEEILKIKNRGFSKYIESSQQIGLTLTITPEKVTFTTTGPDEDSVISFVMSCRFFLQDERINLNKIVSGARLLSRGKTETLKMLDTWERQYKKFCSSHSVVQNFRDTTNAKQFLTSDEIFRTVSDPNLRGTKLQLLERVIYGEIAHKDKVMSERSRKPFCGG